MGGKNPVSDALNAVNRGLDDITKGFGGGGGKGGLAQAADQKREKEGAQYRANQMRVKQKEALEQFKKEAPEIKKGLLDLQNRSVVRNLAEQMRKNKALAASRGLIGMQNYYNAMDTQAAMSGLAQKEYDINKMINDELAGAETSFIQSGIDAGRIALGSQEDFYRNALADIERRTQATRDLMGSIGEFAGTAAANQKKAKTK